MYRDGKWVSCNSWDIAEYYATGSSTDGVQASVSPMSAILIEALTSFIKFDNTYQVFVAPTNPKTGKPFLSGQQFEAAKQEFEAKGHRAITQKDRDIIVKMVYRFQALPEFYEENGYTHPDWSIHDEYCEHKTDTNAEYFQQYADCMLKGILTKIYATSRAPFNCFGEGSVRYRALEELWGQKCWYMQHIHKMATGESCPTQIVLVEKACPNRITAIQYHDLSVYNDVMLDILNRVVDNHSTAHDVRLRSVIL